MKSFRGGAILVFFLAVLLYAGALGHGFHYDDFHSIVYNPHIRSLGNLPAFFREPVLFSVDPQQAMYRPVLLATYALNYAWGEGEPAGYHLVNILLHGVNAALALLLAGTLFGDRRLALLVGLLFAVGPLNAEAVNYVSSRSELLMATFFLLACLSYGRFARTGKGGWYAGALTAGTLALLTKSVAVTLVGVLGLYDWRAGGWRQVKGKRWNYLGFLVVDLLYLLYSRRLVGQALGEPVRSWGTQLWTQLKAGGYYLFLGGMPVRLSVEHQFAVSRGPGEGAVVGAVLLLGSLCFLLGRSRLKSIPFAGGWVLLLMAPTAVVPLIVLVNEHRLYLAGVGWCLLLAWVCKSAVAQRGGVAWVGVGVYTISLACIAFQRSQVWSDELTLWSDAAAKGPLMLKPHLRMGDALVAQGRPREAEAAYRRAVLLRPQHPAARNNLGRLYLEQGRWPEAEAEFRALLQTSPEVQPARLNLAMLLLRQGRWTEAETEYQQALVYDNTQGIAQQNLGHLALQYRQDPARALEYYDQALELGRAGEAEVWCSRGVALKGLGRAGEAERAYREALRLDPGYVDAWFNLGNLYRDSGGWAEASAAYSRVVELDRDAGLTRRAEEQLESLKTITNPRR